MTSRSSFFIEGTPIPQGSKVARVINGRAVMFEANKKFQAWRSAVALAAKLEIQAIEHLFVEPLAVTMTFHISKPKSVTRKHPAVKPDLDKLARNVNDGLVQGGLIKDDALIVHLTLEKKYTVDGQPEGVFITIRHAE